MQITVVLEGSNAFLFLITVQLLESSFEVNFIMWKTAVICKASVKGKNIHTYI